MEKRYQVFVSSTYIDLIPERNEVMQALLELECMPAGMELFPAANETQWEWIKKVIDESDYYIVIVGGRYGTISKETGQSYTEMEYRYALGTGKPVIGFLHEDPSKLPSESVEQSPSTRRKLQAFRDLVGSKLCKKYSSPADLGAKVSRSITQLRKQYPAVGWIRADVLDTFATSDEVLKLKRENEELKERLYQLGESPSISDHLASGSDLFEIQFKYTRLECHPDTQHFRKAAEEWETVKVSWDDIFIVLASELLENPADYFNHVNILSDMVESRGTDVLQEKYPKSRFRDFRIKTKCAAAIMLQLRALKLLNINGKGAWVLTPYGDNYMTSILGVRKGQTNIDGFM